MPFEIGLFHRSSVLLCLSHRFSPYRLLNGNGTKLHDNDEVIFTDVDGIFLTSLPFGASLLGRPGKFCLHAVFRLPCLFYPIAASNQYFLGHEWLTKNDSTIVRFLSAPVPHQRIVATRFDLGPPYVLRVADMRKIIPRWWDIAHEMVLQSDPNVAWSMPVSSVCCCFSFETLYKHNGLLVCVGWMDW